MWSRKPGPQTLEARVAEDATALKADTAEDFVSSGPYTQFFTMTSRKLSMLGMTPTGVRMLPCGVHCLLRCTLHM